MSDLGDRIVNGKPIPEIGSAQHYFQGFSGSEYNELRKELIKLREFREAVESFGPVKSANRRAAMWADAATAETKKRLALVDAFRVLADELRSFDNGRGEGEYFADRLQEVLNEHTR